MDSEQVHTAGKAEEVALLKLDTMRMVGVPVIVSFKDGDFSQIGKTKQRFMERKEEIRHAVDPQTYWSPWYSCKVMFTYFYCLQVSEITDIPEGMMGFTIPASYYAAVRYEGPKPMDPDPYAILATYRKENNIANKQDGMILEKYRFENDCKPGWLALEVFGPVQYGES